MKHLIKNASQTVAYTLRYYVWPYMVGSGFFGLALLMLLSMLSYHPADSSWNVAGYGKAHNWLLSLGSYIADSLSQWLGEARYLFVFFCCTWGWQYWRHRTLPWWFLRLIAAVLCLFLFTLNIALAGLTPMSSLLGYWAQQAAQTLAVFLPQYQPYLTLIGSTFLFIGGMYFATGLKRNEWRALRIVVSIVPQKIYRIIKYISRKKQDSKISETKTAQAPTLPLFKTLEPVIEKNSVQPAALVPQKRLVELPKKARQKEDKEPALDLVLSQSGFKLPSRDLLNDAPKQLKRKIDQNYLNEQARTLETTLRDFGVNGTIVNIRPGPVVTLYELDPAPGTKTSRVVSLADDIARSMSALSVRVAVVPGQNVIGIELPNKEREVVVLKELISSSAFEATAMQLSLILGKDISGQPIVVDLARMPHLLIAGTTGSGKSVSLNALILSLLYRLTPEQCRMIMIDPKMLEFSAYDGIPHLLAPVVTDPKKAVVALKWTVKEMEQRYQMMSKLGVRNIIGYNQKINEYQAKGEVFTRKIQTGFDSETGAPIFEEEIFDTKPLPYIVVIADEIADLMLIAGKEVEASIQRLAQMARAAGIHLILATQRPSVDVITGTIKANLPTRISFHVTSKIDSRTILGEQGAEQLLGMGDMLYMSTGGRIARVHGPMVEDYEVERVVSFLKKQAAPSYIEDVTLDTEETNYDGLSSSEEGGGDELYDQAVAIVCQENKCSTSFVQRQFQIGYNRAARLIERMEKEGILSAPNRMGRREILIKHNQ